MNQRGMHGKAHGKPHGAMNHDTRRAIRRPLRMSPGAMLAAGLLALVCALQLLALLRAPAAWLPAAIDVTLRPGEAITLGRAELGAPRAAARQLVLRRDAGGAWLVRNLEPRQPLALRRGETRVRSSDWPLAPGQQVRAGDLRLAVIAVDAGGVALRDGARTWHYDGATLLRDGEPLPACPDTALSARAVAAWNRTMPPALDLARPLGLGGLLYCGNRIAAAALEPGSAALARLADGRIVLSARGTQPVLVADGGAWTDAAQRELPLEGAETLALGRTLLALAPSGDTLRLVPTGQVALAASPTLQLPPAVRWQWAQRDHLALPSPPPLAWAAAFALLLAGAGLAGPALLRRRGPRRSLVRPLAAGLVAACAMLVLVTQRSSGAPGAGVSLLLGWVALWLALLYPRRAALLPSAAALLLGAGLLVQLEMGLGAADTAWLRHFQNTTALLALALPGALLLLSPFGRDGGAAVSRPATERVLLGCAALALAGLLLQVCFGGETGVFDIQPFEFAKFALAALSAHCLALAAGGIGDARTARDWGFWLRMAAPVLLFVLLAAAALVRVDDYSPLVLLLVWGGAMALAWCASRGRRAALAGLAGAAVLLAGGGALLHSGGAAMGALGFYPERFQVWSAPTAHPHTGQQMLLGARAIAEGGWLGADGLLGLAAPGGAQPGGLGHVDALAIPAIQDDFAPAFLLHRHGLAAGLALWTLQALFLVALLRIAAAAWRAGQAAGDFRRAWLARFQCFALCGGSAFVLGHLLLSWGTNLAMFPIMGQPMSFLSAGGSHLVFFICPLLAFGMASGQSLARSSSQINEESQSCRSMSSTKS